LGDLTPHPIARTVDSHAVLVQYYNITILTTAGKISRVLSN